MNIEDFREICNYIEKNHSFIKADGKMIKYISPTLDMRTGKIFHVNFRRGGLGMDFSTINENKDRDLKSWIIDWLDNGKWKE